MRKLTTRIVAGLALAWGLSGAVQAQTSFGPDDAEETYYWISQNSTLPLFVRTDYRGLERIAEELGVEVRIAGPTNIDLAAFIAAIDQVCAQRPAGVAIVGWDPALAASVDKCIEARVPTVVDDADLPTSDRLAFIGTDWNTIGREQARVIAEKLPDGGQIAMMSIINADNMQRAVQGMRDYFAEQGDQYEIVANEDDGGDASKAAQVTAALLAAYPDIDAFAGFDSESGPGIVQALNEAGAAGDIVVTAMEQSPDFFRTIQDGSVDAIIVQNRELFTYYAIKLLYDFNHNGLSNNGLTGWDGTPIPVNIDTGVLVVTEENVDELIAAIEAQ